MQKRCRLLAEIAHGTAPGLLFALCVLLSACAKEEKLPLPEAVEGATPAPEPRGPSEPQALHLRFQETRGSGLSGESWEIEIFQLADAVRVRGSLRSASVTTPFFRTLTPAEYAGLWQWLRGFPLETFRVEEDPEAPESSWRKELDADVILGADRLQCSGAWERSLLGPEWIGALEDGLHQLAVEYAEEELQRSKAERSETQVAADSAIARALEALGEAK